MNLILNIEEFAGKTIKTATLVSGALGIVFDDNTCALLDVNPYYGDNNRDVELAHDVDEYIGYKAGFITEDEYRRIQKNNAVLDEAYKEQQELAQLAALQKKYGAG